MLKHQPALHTRTARKRPEPSKRVLAPHPLALVRPDTDIPRKLLQLDTDFIAIWTIRIPMHDTRSAKEGMMALDFPAFDRGHVQCERPESAA